MKHFIYLFSFIYIFGNKTAILLLVGDYSTTVLASKWPPYRKSDVKEYVV